MFLKNIDVLIGQELTLKKSFTVGIQQDKFHAMGKQIDIDKTDDVFDCEGLLAFPGLVNLHTHVGDSIAKDATLDGTVDQKIHPIFGMKSKILAKTNPKHLASFVQSSCKTMLKNGITTFVDFREGGLDGVFLLKQALSDIPIRSIILGRVEYYQNKKQIRQNTPIPDDRRLDFHKLLEHSDGIGISGANENSNAVLDFYCKTRKLKAIHAAETKQSVKTSTSMTKKSEVLRALKLKPNFLVHMTFASSKEISLASKKTSLVVCPRANAALAEGIPDVNLMLKKKCIIGLGTDNVMINSPNMFREMDYLWKVTMAINKQRINPKEILKMATTNASKILKKKLGVIKKGFLADCVLIDKHAIDVQPMHNPHASIVHRVTPSNIRAVIIGGKIVYGKI